MGEQEGIEERWQTRPPSEAERERLAMEGVEPARSDREELTMIALALKNLGIEGIEGETTERGVERVIECLYDERKRANHLEANFWKEVNEKAGGYRDRALELSGIDARHDHLRKQVAEVREELERRVDNQRRGREEQRTYREATGERRDFSAEYQQLARETAFREAAQLLSQLPNARGNPAETDGVSRSEAEFGPGESDTARLGRIRAAVESDADLEKLPALRAFLLRETGK